jgi:hypothetical protein
VALTAAGTASQRAGSAVELDQRIGDLLAASTVLLGVPVEQVLRDDVAPDPEPVACPVIGRVIAAPASSCRRWCPLATKPSGSANAHRYGSYGVVERCAWSPVPGASDPRASHLALIALTCACGDDGTRTHDPLLAKQPAISVMLCTENAAQRRAQIAQLGCRHGLCPVAARAAHSR